MNLPFTRGEFITPRQRISWKVMFIQVCLFTGGGGIGRYLTPLRTPPLPTSPKKSSKAGGTHPTGMYSCLRKCINFVEKSTAICSRAWTNSLSREHHPSPAKWVNMTFAMITSLLSSKVRVGSVSHRV